VNQTERFRAELQSRRRRKGESLQSVYNDVRRLLALSFPGYSGEACEVLGRDAFLTALGDQSLRVRVLDQQPTTLDDALAIACRIDRIRRTPGLTTVLVRAINRRTTRHLPPGYRRGLLYRLWLPRQRRGRGRWNHVRRSRKAATSVNVDHSPATPAKAAV